MTLERRPRWYAVHQVGRDGKQKLAQDFVKAWNKVMMLDRFDATQ